MRPSRMFTLVHVSKAFLLVNKSITMMFTSLYFAYFSTNNLRLQSSMFLKGKICKFVWKVHNVWTSVCKEFYNGCLWKSFWKVQTEFSVQRTTKKFSHRQLLQNYLWSVRRECSSCRVYWHNAKINSEAHWKHPII